MIIYIIKSPDGIPVAAAIDETKAIEICEKNIDKDWYYQELPFYK